MACSFASLFTCFWSWMLYSAAGYGAPIAPENTVYFSFLSRWLSQDVRVGQPKTLSLSWCSGDDLCHATCDGGAFCHVCCRKESRRVIDPVTELHPFPLQQAHTHACRPCVRSQKESACCGTRVTLMAFLPWWASALGSGNVIPASLEGTGCVHRSSHFLPAWAGEEVDTLVLCSDKPDSWGDHTWLPGQDVKYAWSSAELNFYSPLCRWCNALTFVRCHSHTFPQLPPVQELKYLEYGHCRVVGISATDCLS